MREPGSEATDSKQQSLSEITAGASSVIVIPKEIAITHRVHCGAGSVVIVYEGELDTTTMERFTDAIKKAMMPSTDERNSAGSGRFRR